MTEAVKAAVVLFILERLFLTRHATWLEEHIDYLSLQARNARCNARGATPMLTLAPMAAQALLYKRAGMTMTKQVLVILMHSKRLADTN